MSEESLTTMNPPTTLPEALEIIEELQRDLRSEKLDREEVLTDFSKLQEEMDALQSSHGSPEALQAFGDKWAKLRNGFIGHAACSLTFATITFEGKGYSMHGHEILDAISKCEKHFSERMIARDHEMARQEIAKIIAREDPFSKIP